MKKIANMNFHYHRYTFDYFLESTKRLGLSAIELWGGAPHVYVEDASYHDIKALSMVIKKRNLELVCFTPEQCIYPINLSSKDNILRNRSIAYFKKCLTVNNSLECPLLLITAGYGFFNEPKEEAWKRAYDSICEISKEAEKQGVLLVLEPLSAIGSNVITNVSTLKKMIKDVGSPNLKAMLDTVPMVLAGDTICDYGTAFGDDLLHIHFLDGDGKTSAHLSWGEGTFPLKSFKQSLEKINYKGYLSLEMIGAQYNWDPEKATKQCLDRLKEISV